MSGRILVVDGDAFEREKLRRQLTDAGFDVAIAETGEEGAMMFEAAPPDIAVIDMSGATKGGAAALARLCEEDGPKPPIIAIAPRHGIDEAFEIGADHFIVRPISRLILVHHFRHILRASRMERELRAAKRAAEAANEAKLNFLANISHELRTPLHAIIGFADLLRAPDLALDHDRCMEYCGLINDSGEHLLAIINDLLKLSQIEAGRYAIEETLAPAEACVAGPLALIRPLAQAKGHSLNFDAALDEVLVLADQRALRQVMLNLLSNAVKFTDEGGAIKVAAWREANGWMVYEVADTGVGMTAEEAERVLKPFEQVDSSLNRSEGGAGLGLPLAAAMVAEHGGRLEMESAPGEGTKVRFRLPASRVRIGTADAA